MKAITTIAQLTVNLKKLKHYLQLGSSEEQQEARRFIQQGTCFIAYDDEGIMRFAPSRFLGYENNTFEKHSSNDERHGSITNAAISKLVGRLPVVQSELEEQYQQYCHSLGIKPRPKGSFGASRKYWKL
jgi:hypothetical protein